MKKTIVLLLCVIGIKAFAQYSTPCLDYRVPGILTDLGVVQSLILTNWPDYTDTVAKAAAVPGVESNLSDHVSDTDNPHSVTPEQIGAATAAHTQDWSTISGTPTTMSGYGITDSVPPAAWSTYPAQQEVDFASKGALGLARISAPNYSNLVWGYSVDAPKGNPGDGCGIIIGHEAKGGDGSTVIGGGAKDYTASCSLFGRFSMGREVSSVFGMYGDATNYSTAIGFRSKAYNHSVALGNQSSADNGAVSIGHGITNTVPASTRITGDLRMAGSNILDAGNVVTTNLQITGGSPTNGAVWVATNTAGQGTWSVLPKIYATSNDKGMVFTNGVFTPLVFTNNLKQVGGGTFDGTSWTPGIVGWGQVHVFVNAASHVSTGLFQLVATGESTGSQYQYIYIPNIVPRLSFSKLMYFETPESSVYFRILHVHGHNLTNSGTMSFYGAMLP